jgi:hypothetical protein
MKIFARFLGLLIAAFIVLPSTANAYSRWSGWESYAECIDYYTANPPTAGCISNGFNLICHPAYTSEQMCAVKKAEEAAKRREQEETRRLIILGCRAGSVSYDQFAACVALATSQ